MDCMIWENTIVSWVNSIVFDKPEQKITRIDNDNLNDVLKKLRPEFQKPSEFLMATFPNLIISDEFSISSSFDYLCAATLFLIYISFSTEIELEEFRKNMCKNLDNTTQYNIAEFLTNLQNHEDVFQLSLDIIKKEILIFSEKFGSHPTEMGDIIKTPIKQNVSNNSFDSPLQGFFQTPKRSGRKHMSTKMCGDGDHYQIKELRNQLIEEELEKTALQEKLNLTTARCSEYENKLKLKIEEIKCLKNEWEKDSKNYEAALKELQVKVNKKIEDEKKLKSEITHLETVSSSVESDLSSCISEKAALEHQLKLSQDKCTVYELQLMDAIQQNENLEEIIANKEKELVHLKENYVDFYKDEKAIDVSFAEGSFDASTCVPENMGIVTEKILKEKIEENNDLKETIKELLNEKTNLNSEIEKINQDLIAKNLAVAEVQFLNRELFAKIANFEVTEKALQNVQEQLEVANENISKLTKENSHLTEKCKFSNTKALEHDEALKNYKNSNILVHKKIFKLAEDFRLALQFLEFEISNIFKTAPTKNQKVHISELSVLHQEEVYEQTFCLYKTAIANELYLDIEKNLEELNDVSDNFENLQFDWAQPKKLMEKYYKLLNNSITTLKIKVNEIKGENETLLEEKEEIKTLLKKATEEIFEIKSTYTSELSTLKEKLQEKEAKILNLENILELKMNQVSLKDSLLNTKSVKEAEQICFTTTDRDKTVLLKKHLIPAEGKEMLEKSELDDSLEEAPVCNKTFDIVNLEDKNVANKTFLITKEFEPLVSDNKGAAWLVSPPSKGNKNLKPPEKKFFRGESWIVPLTPVREEQEKSSKASSSENGVTETDSNLTRSLSHSSLVNINYTPPSTKDSKSSRTSFFSLTDLSDQLKIHLDDQAVIKKGIKKSPSCEMNLQNFKEGNYFCKNKKSAQNPEIRVESSDDSKNCNAEWESKISQMRKEIIELSKECEHLRSVALESEQKRKREKDSFYKNQDLLKQNIVAKYENQLEHLKSEMKQLYNKELAKHKNEQLKISSEVREQNKRFKEHIDQLRNQLWDLGEKLLQEQKQKRDLERLLNELKKKYESVVYSKDSDFITLQSAQLSGRESCDDRGHPITMHRLPNATFPTIPTEDEDEVFDNRFLQDMKTGFYLNENPEKRLMELQNRNTLCLPHLKSSYPAETQFHNPTLFKECDLKMGLLQFGHESQSLTDSDQSMTRSLLPENKVKKKEQTSYKRPGPPTPSKNGGRLSLQSGDFRLTPRNVLKEINDQNERNKGTPGRLKTLLSTKTVKIENVGRDENSVPVTPRKKLGKIFRKPFGARDH